MKKLMLALLAVVALSGCGKSNAPTATSVVGNWMLTQKSGSAVSAANAEFLILNSNLSFTDTSSNGAAYNEDDFGNPINGVKYVLVNNSQINFTYDDGSQLSYKASIANNQLTLTSTSSSSVTYVYQSLSAQQLQAQASALTAAK